MLYMSLAPCNLSGKQEESAWKAGCVLETDLVYCLP